MPFDEKRERPARTARAAHAERDSGEERTGRPARPADPNRPRLTEEQLREKCEREVGTVRTMIGIYCSGHHHERAEGERLCPECAELAEYAEARLRGCPRMEEKTFCSACPIHCYRPEMRERIKQVMAYAGPRMMLRDPKRAIQHLFQG